MQEQIAAPRPASLGGLGSTVGARAWLNPDADGTWSCSPSADVDVLLRALHPNHAGAELVHKEVGACRPLPPAVTGELRAQLFDGPAVR